MSNEGQSGQALHQPTRDPGVAGCVNSVVWWTLERVRWGMVELPLFAGGRRFSWSEGRAAEASQCGLVVGWRWIRLGMDE